MKVFILGDYYIKCIAWWCFRLSKVKAGLFGRRERCEEAQSDGAKNFENSALSLSVAPFYDTSERLLVICEAMSSITWRENGFELDIMHE